MRKIRRSAGATGGNYSDGYVVDDARGTTAFLRVFDFSEARAAPDEALAVQAMINAMSTSVNFFGAAAQGVYTAWCGRSTAARLTGLGRRAG